MMTIEEIRRKREALPPGKWFWKCDLGRLTLYRRHPVLRGWREILCARRLGMDGATMDVADPAVVPEDPLDHWESCEMVKVTRDTHIPDLLVMDWIAESPAIVDDLLHSIDQLREECDALLGMVARAADRVPAEHVSSALRILDAAAEAAHQVPDGYALVEAVLSAIEALKGDQ